MRPTPYIYIIGLLSLLTAACSDDIQPTYTVGAEHNAITLRAAIGSGEDEVASRAPDPSHENHVVFNSGLLHLRVDGVWKGHEPEDVHKKTFGTVGYADEGGILQPHNPLTLSPSIFWDDFGTADPANMTPVVGNGRDKGLRIFGVTVDGYADHSQSPPVFNILPNGEDANQGNNLMSFSYWTIIPWTLPLNQEGGTTNFDLLTSNNIQEGKDGTLKFDEWKANAANTSDLLVFTHAMSKVSVKLTADEGFEGYDYETNDNTSAKFHDPPKVTLLNYYYKGNVNVEAKVSTPITSNQGDIITHPYIGGVGTHHFAHSYALVFPGNSFADDVNVVRIDADGNIYYITAEKMNAAMKLAQGGSTTYLQGKHYIFNVTVKKTGVDVTATIKDWEKVEAADETPIINFSECYGHTGNALTTPFSLYRSTSIDGTYTGPSDQAVVTYDNGTSKYTMSPQLYWPDHQTHYFFRGIWPKVGSEDGPAAAKITGGNSIEVENADYDKSKYPSDLMIGRPRVAAGGAPDETCKNPAHQREDGTYPAGICATDSKDGSSGLIRMNFQYAMSQVIVKLTTSDGQANELTINKHTKVEIVGGYSEGKIHLGTGASDFTGKTVTPYPMTNDNGIDNPVEGNDYANYRNTIIPQALTNASGDLKFRITISANGSATDAYETVLGIKEIKVTEGGVLKNITAWEPGKRYIYNLHITKTGISVTATVTDWKTVDASEDIWM